MKSIGKAILVFKLLALFVCTVNAEADAFSINNPFDKHGTEANLLGSAVYPIIISLAILQPVVIILLIKALKKNKKILMELQEGKIKYQTLFESMKEGLVIGKIAPNAENSQRDYLILDVNRAYENITGLRREDVINKSAMEVFPLSEEYWVDGCRKAVYMESTYSCMGYSRDLKKYLSVNIFVPDKGKLAMVISDVTEDRLQKEKLVSLNKELMATYTLRDRIFMVLARDIREPLATLVNLTELLVEDKSLCKSENLEISNEIQEYVSNVFANVEILLRWFESKKSGDIYTPLSWGLSELLQEALEMVKIMLEAKNISVVSEIQYETKVYADKEMLGLVFRNLLSNAVKFMGRNERILIASELEKEMVVVSFKDSGIGIAAEKVQLLFQDVNGKATAGTEGETGLGLGLFLCRQLIQRNGGDIWLESTVGEGSTFYISIPSSCPKK